MFNIINKIKNRKGFTLVELLVVLAVLAIISAIAIPRFAGVQKSAKEKADLETIETIKRAIELYNTAESTALTVSTLTVAEGGTATSAVINTLVSKGYLKSAPKCAEHGNYFVIDASDLKTITH